MRHIYSTRQASRPLPISFSPPSSLLPPHPHAAPSFVSFRIPFTPLSPDETVRAPEALTRPSRNRHESSRNRHETVTKSSRNRHARSPPRPRRRHLPYTRHPTPDTLLRPPVEKFTSPAWPPVRPAVRRRHFPYTRHPDPYTLLRPPAEKLTSPPGSSARRRESVAWAEIVTLSRNWERGAAASAQAEPAAG
jgi:hypothetical protein